MSPNFKITRALTSGRNVETREAIRLLLAGKRPSEVYKKLQISPGTVLYWFSVALKAGLVRRPPPRASALLGRVRKMKLSGMTYAQIAKRMKVSPQRVTQIMLSASIPFGPGVCSGCGRRVDRLNRHHPSYDSDDVIPLCKACHARAHYNPNTLTNIKN